MRKILILVVTVSFSVSLQAQIKFAIKGGVNYSSARVEYRNDLTQTYTKQPSSYKPGYGFGIMLDVPFEGKLHFMPSASYNSRGYKYNPTSGDTTQMEATITYFDITPSFSFNLNAGKTNRFVLFAGPELGIALSGKEKITQDGTTTSKKMKISLEQGFSMFDLGVTSGIGFHTRKFMIEGVFQFGLANINNNAEFDKLNIRNRMLSLNIGYFIR